MSGYTITSMSTLPELSEQANTITKWFRGDNEEAYNRNVQNGEFIPYGPNDVTYDFNSLGFRCPEFDVPVERPKMAFYGCSIMQGYGLPEQESIPSVVTDLQREYVPYNLGIAGASNDLIARSITSTIPLLNPDFVVILWTYHTRREIYSEDGTAIQWLRNWEKQTVRVEAEATSHMHAQNQLSHFVSNINNQILNMTLVDLFLKNRNIPYVWAMVNTYWLTEEPVREKLVDFQYNFTGMMGINDLQCDVSRDLMHPGKRTVEKMSRHISETINQVC